MFLSPLHTFFYLDNKFIDTQDSDQLEKLQGNILYEVVRVIDGVILFWEDHQERLFHSIKRSNLDFSMDLRELESLLKQLIELNRVDAGNIAIQLWAGAVNSHLALSFIQHRYPSKEQYTQGVATKTYPIERKDPNIKQSEVNKNLRAKIGSVLRSPNVYEVLLVNHENEITEGSRTNVFFIKGSTIITIGSKKVLEGITRKRVIKICRNLGLELKCQPVYPNDLSNIQAAFLTGTSPKILPISKIDVVELNPINAVLLSIKEAYNKEIEVYCKQKKPD